MTDKQILNLANHLRNLATKLAEGDIDWKNWVVGNLEGTADILEMGIKEEE